MPFTRLADRNLDYAVASHLDGISTDEEASHVPRTFYEPNKVVCKLESLTKALLASKISDPLLQTSVVGPWESIKVSSA